MDGMNTENFEQQNQSPQGFSKDERTWAMIAHISAVAGFIFPFGNIIAPLLIWVLKKDELPFVGDQGKEALNFQISVSIYILVSVVLILLLIGIALIILLALFAIIMTIIAAINAYDGKVYRYPLTIRLIK